MTNKKPLIAAGPQRNSGWCWAIQKYLLGRYDCFDALLETVTGWKCRRVGPAANCSMKSLYIGTHTQERCSPIVAGRMVECD